MEKIGTALVSADNKTIQVFGDIPGQYLNPPSELVLENGNIVCGAIPGDTLSDGSRFLDVYSDNYPSQYCQIASKVPTLDNDRVVLICDFYDTRYYTVNGEGSVVPLDLPSVKTTTSLINQEEAKSILSNTDWYIIREIDAGNPVPDNVRQYRSSIRTASNSFVADVISAANVDAVAAIVDAFSWPTYQL